MSEFERNDMFEENEDYGTGGYADDLAEADKPKKKKKPVKRTSGKKVEGKLTVAFVALALMFITFVVLVVLENKMVNSGEKVNVVVAIAEVPEGIELTQANMPSYFGIEERNKEDIPLGVTTYANGTPMIGMITDRVIHTKEVITNECFYEKSFFDDIEDAVELSIDLGAIGQTVGGTLRPGDKVDIKAVIKVNKDSLIGNVEGEDSLVNIDGSSDELLDTGVLTPVEGEVVEEDAADSSIATDGVISIGQGGDVFLATDEELRFGITGDYVSQVIAEDVVVVAVFNSGGETLQAVEAAGGNMVATVVNVAVPSNLVDAILLAKAEGTLTLARVYEEEEAEEIAPADGEATTTDGAAAEATPVPEGTTAQ